MVQFPWELEVAELFLFPVCYVRVAKLSAEGSH